MMNRIVVARALAEGAVFERLRNAEDFAQIRIGERGRYIEFPGDIDFCAHALREQLVASEPHHTPSL